MMESAIEERPIVERTGYYFREEVGDVAREIGFETQEELLAYIASIDAKYER